VRKQSVTVCFVSLERFIQLLYKPVDTSNYNALNRKLYWSYLYLIMAKTATIRRIEAVGNEFVTIITKCVY